jgi:hypothetical protein
MVSNSVEKVVEQTRAIRESTIGRTPFGYERSRVAFPKRNASAVRNNSAVVSFKVNSPNL